MLPADKEFFASYDFSITEAPTKRERLEKQTQVLSNPDSKAVYERYVDAFRGAERILESLYRYQVVEVDGDKTIGKQDAFRAFMERATQLIRSSAYVGLLVPSSFHANEGATGVRRLYLDNMLLKLCYSFENRKKFFDIDSRFKFVCIVAEKSHSGTSDFSAAFYLQDENWLFDQREPEPALTYSLEFVRRTTGELASFLELRSRMDLCVAETCFGNGEPLGNVLPRLGIRFGRELNMTDDSWRFTPISQVCSPKEDPRDPLVMAHLIKSGIYMLQDDKTFEIYSELSRKWRPRYLLRAESLHNKLAWVSQLPYFRLAYRDITVSTNQRTCICNVLPPGSLFGNTTYVDRESNAHPSSSSLAVLAIMASFTFDYVVRLKTQNHLNLFIINTCCLPAIEQRAKTLAHCAMRLVANHSGYAPLWNEQFPSVWRESTPLSTWPVLVTEDDRWEIRAATDAVVADAYGLSRDQFVHVLSTFNHKSYPKAPELCLAMFDELKAIGLDAFSKKHDPYWDIPLNEGLPQPVIDLPIPAGGAGAGNPTLFGDTEPTPSRKRRTKR
jgi:hypothetical protein